MLESEEHPVADWHPIMQLREYQPGRWVMFDVHEKPFALIDLVRRGPELGYRVNRWAQDTADQTTIGYYRNLRAAASAAHSAKIHVQMPDIRTASSWG